MTVSWTNPRPSVEICSGCGQEIEGTRYAGNWRDRSGGRNCLPYSDSNGGVVYPPADQLHAPEPAEPDFE